jgi:5-methylcytosine-specific restriction endonuclease McrA
MGLKKYDKEWLEELCAESNSLAEVLKKAGRKQGGGSQQILKDKIAEYDIDISHFTGQLWNKGKTREDDERIAMQAKNQEKYSLEEVFKKDSKITQHGLREYIQKYNAIEYRCSKCGCNGHWQDGEIRLEIHHKDGDNHNNEIDNLTYLCPNCHALTDNFRGRNKKQSQNGRFVSEEDFVKALKEWPNIRQALLSLNLTARGGNYDRAKVLIKKYNIQK